MTNLVVVNNPNDWQLDVPGIRVVSARSYLTDPSFSELEKVKVFNLCRSYRYQANGYYVSLLAAARAWALLDERDAVVPEDVQAVLPGIASHRLQGVQDVQTSDGDKLAKELIEAVPIP